jgi:hypothetical protein
MCQMFVTSWRLMIFGICQIKSKSAFLLHDADLIFFLKKNSWAGNIFTGTWQNCASFTFTGSSSGCQKAQSKPFIQPPSALKGSEEARNENTDRSHVVYLCTTTCQNIRHESKSSKSANTMLGGLCFLDNRGNNSISFWTVIISSEYKK